MLIGMLDSGVSSEIGPEQGGGGDDQTRSVRAKSKDLGRSIEFRKGHPDKHVCGSKRVRSESAKKEVAVCGRMCVFWQVLVNLQIQVQP
jgi:hypothetical protein